MSRKRVFIAINLPEGIRAALEEEAADMYAHVPESVRFAAPESWHFTLAFLGYQTDEAIGEIVAALQEVAPRFTAPEITVNRIVYGPPGKTPRMIWATTDERASSALNDIKTALEDALVARGIRFDRERRKYRGHTTLARFETGLGELPDIEKPLALSFVPESVDLMESVLKRTGAEYALMTAVEFGDDTE